MWVRSSAVVRAVLITGALVTGALGLATARAQPAEPGPIPIQPNVAKMFLDGHKFTFGEPCTMMTRNQPGIIKRDACQRWYCGRKEYQDIVQLRPNFASEMGCQWRIVGMHCLCQRPSGQAVQPVPNRN